MQGYGVRRGRRSAGLRVTAAIAAAAALAVTASGCGLLEEQNRSKPIEIPGTNALVTESAPASLSTSQTPVTTSRTYTPAPRDSYDRLISSAPRAGLADFRRGATTAAGERLEGLSGIHFSTPDRVIRCSTGNNGADALVCASDRIDGPDAAPHDAPAGCEWDPNLAVLSASGFSAGGCTNLYPVLYRSHILEYGESIVVDRFSCLSEVAGLYCLAAGSDEGFAITRTGVEKIHPEERAPNDLIGDTPADSSAVTTTPTR